VSGLWTIAWLALAAAGAQAGTSQVDVREQRYLGLDQLLKILELSPRAYTLENTNQVGRAGLVERMYPQRRAPIDHPWCGPAGTAPPAAFPIEKAAARQIERGRRHLAAGRIERAETAFRRALAIQPNAYPALLGLGQLELKKNRPAFALPLFHRARVDNPDDPLVFRLLGDAVAADHLGDQARAFYIQALARRPRDPQVLAGLARLGLAPPADLFRPRAAAKRQGGRMAVYYDATVPASRAWLAWAAARAAWLGEPDLRLRFGGTAERTDWSTQQELFCLDCLLGTYLEARRSGKMARLADLERLLEIKARGMLTEYVLYAMGTRLDPNAALMLTTDQRRQMETFLDLFVVPKSRAEAP